MMAVETFVYLYIIGFGVSAFIAILLLVTAARRISSLSSNTQINTEPPKHLAKGTVADLGKED